MVDLDEYPSCTDIHQRCVYGSYAGLGQSRGPWGFQVERNADTHTMCF